METEDFENKLLKMTKPEVIHLSHQDALADAIIKAKDKLVLSWWWLSIPLYVFAAFVMKSFYVPGTTVLSGIREFAAKERLLSALLFLIMPSVLIILNFISIRNIYRIRTSTKEFLQVAWINLLMVFFSILALIIYVL